MTEAVLSTHKVEVVSVSLEKHPNADRLSVVKIFDYHVCTGTDEWRGLSPDFVRPDGSPVWKGAYVPPDSVVDVRRPEFAFLAPRANAEGKARIKAMKLRGVVSFGLLVPAPEGCEYGDDVAARLGVEHYEPPVQGEKGEKFFTGGEEAPPPGVWAVKYDVDAFRRFGRLFVPGEPVVVTEKLDGCNARFVFNDGKMHAGSRTEWKKEFPSYDHLTVENLVERGMDATKAQEVLDKLHSRGKKRNLWWEVLARTPALEKFCRDNPDVVVYGEIYGNVNCIKYGLPENRFAAFDLMRASRWLDAAEARDLSKDLPWVPDAAPAGTSFDFDMVCSLAEGPTIVPGAAAGVIREGVVVKPVRERYAVGVGRVNFKCVSAAYLEKYR